MGFIERELIIYEIISVLSLLDDNELFIKSSIISNILEDILEGYNSTHNEYEDYKFLGILNKKYIYLSKNINISDLSIYNKEGFEVLNLKNIIY